MKKKVKKLQEINKSLNDILIGTTLGVINIFCVAFVVTANKILVNNKVPIGTQMLFVGIATFFYSIIFTLIFREVCLKVGYLILCLFHGFFFYLGNFLRMKHIKECKYRKLLFLIIYK